MAWGRGWGGLRRRGPAAGGAGDEHGVDGPLLHLLHPPLLQTEVRNELGEGRVGDEAEVHRGIAEVLVEPDGGRPKEVIIDLCANNAELVSESLQAATIVIDGGVVLVAPKKLLLQKKHDAGAGCR